MPLTSTCPSLAQVGISACEELDVASIIAVAGEDKEKQAIAVAQASGGGGNSLAQASVDGGIYWHRQVQGAWH